VETHHALAVCGYAVGQYGEAQLIETLLDALGGPLEQQHIEVRHGAQCRLQVLLAVCLELDVVGTSQKARRLGTGSSQPVSFSLVLRKRFPASCWVLYEPWDI
jgi:hypothetical protein